MKSDAVILIAALAVNLFSLGVYGLHADAYKPHWPELRCTFGFDLNKSFLQMPRTAKDALEAGYYAESGTSEKDCKDGPFQGIRYVHEYDPSIALLMDRNGIICGLQAQIAHKDMNKPCNPSKFDEVPMYQTVTVKGEDYYVTTMYFIDPEKICKKGRTEEDLMKEGTGDGIWYQNGTGSYIDVPMQRQAALTKGWSDNQCFRGMGRHSLYQTEHYEDHGCTKIQPTILLYDPVTYRLHGAGFTFVGSCPRCGRCENPPAAVLNIVYNPMPQCLADLTANCGGCTLHCYFRREPWNIKCP